MNSVIRTSASLSKPDGTKPVPFNDHRASRMTCSGFRSCVICRTRLAFPENISRVCLRQMHWFSEIPVPVLILSLEGPHEDSGFAATPPQRQIPPTQNPAASSLHRAFAIRRPPMSIPCEPASGTDWSGKSSKIPPAADVFSSLRNHSLSGPAIDTIVSLSLTRKPRKAAKLRQFVADLRHLMLICNVGRKCRC